MNILMISLDKKLFQKNSAVQKRLIKYGQLCEQLLVIVFTKKGYEKIQLAGNVWIYPTNSLNKLFYIPNAYNLAKSLITHRPLKISSWTVTTQDPFETALIGYGLKKKFNLVLNIQIHGDFFSSPYYRRESFLDFIRFYLGRFLIKKADSLRAVSQRIKNHLIEKYKIQPEKIILAPVYTNIKKFLGQEPKFDLRARYPNYAPIILMASRLAKVKHVDLVMRIFSEIIEKHPRALLIIVGSGPEKKKLKTLRQRLNLEKYVVFKKQQKDLLSYYKTADLFILSSNYEGYGLTVIEAMASGLPVIMTNVGCAGDIVKNKENGLVVPVNNKKELEKALLKMIENPSLREKLRQAGLATVKKLPSEEEILNLYKQSWYVRH